MLLISIVETFSVMQILNIPLISALQTKLNEEKSARQKADQNSQEKERQISMLSVDYRQIQQRLQKLEGEFRQVSLFILQLMFNLIITIVIGSGKGSRTP